MVVNDRSTPVITIAVTRAAGQVSYPLLFMLASGQVFGSDQRIRLKLLESTPFQTKCEGLSMELFDCAFECLDSVVATTDPREAFSEADWCLFVGGYHQHPGMTKEEFVHKNAELMKEQGMALNEVGKDDAKVLVVANPCNTNCLVLSQFATRVDRANIFGLSYLDENRSVAILAKELGVKVSDISNLAVWGNHSSTVFPDFKNAQLKKQPIAASLESRGVDLCRLKSFVRGRGAEVIEVRGHNSAASAAKSTVDCLKFLTGQQPAGEVHSVIVESKGEYGVSPGLWFSYPCYLQSGSILVSKDFALDNLGLEEVAGTHKEIVSEHDLLMQRGFIKGL